MSHNFFKKIDGKIYFMDERIFLSDLDFKSSSGV